ncbi:terpene synthase [Diplodia corticola]|uniref:Terpene synthase n=1 Tax=Diplodia corticola TaxID=236234 RepID=A0A1J9RXP5_9PEZI|nr:terpene synthase [Diplodia corticola]OJD32245.1 terpene synthase [Diplodia corticola]
MLFSAIPSEKLRQAFKIADIGLLGACVYPFASYDRLKIAALLNIWIFIVDDGEYNIPTSREPFLGDDTQPDLSSFVLTIPPQELDMESGTMVDDLETSNRYRAELVDYVRRCLGLADDGEPQPGRRPAPVDDDDSTTCAVNGTGYSHIIQSFSMLGQEIQAVYNMEQRQRLLDNVIFYLGMTREEQCSRLAGGIPTPEEYWKFRDGASAVEVCLAMVEYLAKASGLPKQVFEDPDMKRLWTLTNTNVSLVNDCFSAKKELAGESIANAIPIWYAKAQDGSDRMQVATNQAVSMFIWTVGEMDDVAQKLMRRFGNGDLVHWELLLESEDASLWTTG